MTAPARGNETVPLTADERRGALVPVWREIPADLETPVSAFLKLARGRYSYLLESVEGGERLARYSFAGTDPYLVLRVRDGIAEYHWLAGERADTVERVPCADPLEAVRAELERRPVARVPGLPRFSGGAVGYLAYEAAARFEPSAPIPASDPLGLPEAVFCFSDTLLIFDHVRHTAQLLTYADLTATDGDEQRARDAAHARLDAMARRLAGPVPRRPFPVGTAKHRRGVAVASGADAPAADDAGWYTSAVARIKDYISAGDCFQVVPSRRVARPTSAHPFAIYRALRSINPSPYMFYLALDDFAVVGASPELLVRVEDGEVAVHPIAGTRRRDADPARDAALEAELRADEKERAEHVMLVDLGRNDVGRVSEPGSVRVTQFLDVERYSHVMHLVSHVTGRLRAGLTAYDALRAGFPAGTVSGAPKVRAMQIIAELEGQRRGIYAGAVGHFGYDGALDTCIAIRTLVVKDGIAYAQAGGGIVADSQPDAEYQETENKLSAVLRALDAAEARTVGARPASSGGRAQGGGEA
ncbi:MAG: Anthranilate synthase, aminase component [Ktedonobacterales bacterium]|jgi:anthranilate synthase component 1|nr:MAG: Anthranilate synthase, aminase component [Ktedonobacterales bacterium]